MTNGHPQQTSHHHHQPHPNLHHHQQAAQTGQVQQQPSQRQQQPQLPPNLFDPNQPPPDAFTIWLTQFIRGNQDFRHLTEDEQVRKAKESWEQLPPTELARMERDYVERYEAWQRARGQQQVEEATAGEEGVGGGTGGGWG